MNRRALVWLLSPLVVLACSSAETAQLEQRGPAGPVPLGLARFYDQPLSWGPCPSYASSSAQQAAFSRPGVHCARLTVPLDYAQPNGRVITLGLLRRPAVDTARRVGALVINPGGPGASGMLTAASLGRATELAQRFDIVGFDPRGVGASEPAVRCRSDAERDAERLDVDNSDSPQAIADTEQEEKNYAALCAQKMGTEVLASLGTKDVAKDIDVLRSALGEPKLNFLGYSYGSRIGTQYAEAFPNNVRAMVLDGALDPEQDAIAELVAQGKGFQQAFNAFAENCVTDAACPLGTNQAEVISRFHALVRPLLINPAPVDDGRKLSYSDAKTAVVQALYTESLWPSLRNGLRELQLGKGNQLIRLADDYYERDSNGHYTNSEDAFTAIRCVDDLRMTDPNQRRELDRQYRQAAPFLDDGQPLSPAREACAFWSVPPTSQPHLPQAAGLPTTLVISTTGDPATPYQAGVSLARALQARLLSYEANQHTIFLLGNDCVDQIGTRYLLDVQLPPQDVRCR